MTIWDWALLEYVSLGRHAPAIVFELFLLVSLIVLRVCSRWARKVDETQNVETASLVVQPNQ
jgi:hypothetical protein